jgi:hypothetical protein
LGKPLDGSGEGYLNRVTMDTITPVWTTRSPATHLTRLALVRSISFWRVRLGYLEFVLRGQGREAFLRGEDLEVALVATPRI